MGKKYCKRTAISILVLWREEGREGISNFMTYVSRKFWNSLHFNNRIFNKGSTRVNEVVYKILFLPICWDPNIKSQAVIKCVVRKSRHEHEKIITFGWEPLELRCKYGRLWALFNSYTGHKAWKGVLDKLQKSTILGRGGHTFKIKTRFRKTAVGKYNYWWLI